MNTFLLRFFINWENIEIMKKKFIIIFSLACIIILTVVIYVLYVFNYIPHKKYTNKDFNIKTYISSVDKDEDGIDDQLIN